jgi:hypothetical protein
MLGLREVVLHGRKNEPIFHEFGSRHVCTGDAERNDLPCCQGQDELPRPDTFPPRA